MHSLRLIIPATLLLALTACGGGGGLGNIFGGGLNNQCQAGSQVQVVSPTPSQFNSNVNQVTIVASSQFDNIHPQPQNWSIVVTGNFGQTITGGPLNPIPDTGAPHPFATDFYYQSQLSQTLPSGQTWNVGLQQNTSSCTPLAVGSFST